MRDKGREGEEKIRGNGRGVDEKIRPSVARMQVWTVGREQGKEDRDGGRQRGNRRKSDSCLNHVV